MPQLIYLSRHGTVRINKEDIPTIAPGAYDLLEESAKECQNLGKYLNTFHIPNPFFVDSGLLRTVESVRLVAESMGIPLQPGKNYFSADKLGEEVHWEGLTTEKKQEYYCGQHQRIAPRLAIELGEEVHQKLYEIARDHPVNNLIAILHGGINMGLIAYLTGQLKAMDNCGLYVLERTEDRLKILSDYISPERMREELVSGRVESVKQALR